MENLTGSLEGIDDSRETRCQEDDISRRASSVGGTFHSDTSIGFLERWSVIDTIASHGHQVPTLLEDLDYVVLMLREDFGETISSLNEIVDFRTRHFTTTTKTEALSIVHIGAETELT